MCKIFAVSTSAYYEAISKPSGKDHSLLRSAIVDVQRAADWSYGYRRIVPELRSLGLRCGKRLVMRLMLEHGLHLRLKLAKPYGKPKKAEVQAVPNELNRQFLVHAPNRVWVSDITYIHTRSGWVYLAVVLDLFARVVVGWSVSNSPNSGLVLDALSSAIKKRQPGRGVMMHTDQGCQYTSLAWRSKLELQGFRLSMSGRGQCWDNAPMESWNGTLKRESRVVTTLRDDVKEVREVLFRWIEGWYNTRRRHSGNGYVSPAEYERKWAA
jgi:putative transposase